MDNFVLTVKNKLCEFDHNNTLIITGATGIGILFHWLKNNRTGRAINLFLQKTCWDKKF